MPQQNLWKKTNHFLRTFQIINMNLIIIFAVVLLKSTYSYYKDLKKSTDRDLWIKEWQQRHEDAITQNKEDMKKKKRLDSQESIGSFWPDDITEYPPGTIF